MSVHTRTDTKVAVVAAIIIFLFKAQGRQAAQLGRNGASQGAAFNLRVGQIKMSRSFHSMSLKNWECERERETETPWMEISKPRSRC
jgi:hypothetical protein